MKRLNTLILTVLAMFLFTAGVYADSLSVDAISLSLNGNANQIGSVFKLNDNWTINPKLYCYLKNNNYNDYKDYYLNLGAGAFYHPNCSEQFDIYYGPRINFGIEDVKEDKYEAGYFITTKSNTKSYGIEGVFGAEYHFNKNFSLAGEIGVVYLAADSDLSLDGGPAAMQGTDNVKTHVLKTTSQILVVYHF